MMNPDLLDGGIVAPTRRTAMAAGPNQLKCHRESGSL
jgi:hypothetical protein